MTWRKFLMWRLVILVTLLVSGPLYAQQRMPHVGMLNYAGPSDVRAKQFSEALRALGYREGSNLKTHAQVGRWKNG